MKNVKYHTVNYGVDIHLDTQAQVNRASHEKDMSTKKELSREVTKGKSEVDLLDINEVIGGNTKVFFQPQMGQFT